MMAQVVGWVPATYGGHQLESPALLRPGPVLAILSPRGVNQMESLSLLQIKTWTIFLFLKANVGRVRPTFQGCAWHRWL